MDDIKDTLLDRAVSKMVAIELRVNQKEDQKKNPTFMLTVLFIIITLAVTGLNLLKARELKQEIIVLKIKIETIDPKGNPLCLDDGLTMTTPVGLQICPIS